ncbi:MAG: hypothetical protein CG439_517 [Methylococcaceae bacterium NSP1-2]|nr:DUF882 domain-containing protein [Methylococcaceae bacterium]OYV20336.1 MAG: hypothetical protein CG439_517 [Methylococcaceae bacterium NSP1-2]
MNNQLLKTLTINETDVIASRRGFLTRMAYGSLLAMSGSGIAEAAVKHVIHAPTHNKKADVKHTNSLVKSSLHERSALKTANTHHNQHSAHKELFLKTSNSRVHNSLHKAHDGGHRLHHDVRERLALQDNARIHHSLHRDFPANRNDMPEFAMHQDDLSSRFSSDTGNRFSLQGTGTASTVNTTHKTLALQNTTTGDSLNVTYFERGRYLPDALHEINHLYRDHLTDEIHPVDTALLDQLHDLQATLGIKKPIHVICGYRSPFTNAHLRRNSRGVARNSLHMEGRAIDIRISGVESRTIRDAALSMARGGVGYYPGSNFVHLDTGEFRTW